MGALALAEPRRLGIQTGGLARDFIAMTHREDIKSATKLFISEVAEVGALSG